MLCVWRPAIIGVLLAIFNFVSHVTGEPVRPVEPSATILDADFEPSLSIYRLLLETSTRRPSSSSTKSTATQRQTTPQGNAETSSEEKGHPDSRQTDSPGDATASETNSEANVDKSAVLDVSPEKRALHDNDPLKGGSVEDDAHDDAKDDSQDNAEGEPNVSSSDDVSSPELDAAAVDNSTRTTTATRRPTTGRRRKNTNQQSVTRRATTTKRGGNVSTNNANLENANERFMHCCRSYAALPPGCVPYCKYDVSKADLSWGFTEHNDAFTSAVCGTQYLSEYLYCAAATVDSRQCCLSKKQFFGRSTKCSALCTSEPSDDAVNELSKACVTEERLQAILACHLANLPE